LGDDSIYAVSQDAMGTHLDWQHKDVTAAMIDWFWSNMEKCFLLWHPEEHQPLTWAIPPKHGNLIGAVHIAPQTWSDGTFQNLYIRFENLDDVPQEIKKYVVCEHCIIVAGLGFGEESLQIKEPMGYRIHQWQNDGKGVVGKSNAFGWKKPENKEQGMVWAKHAVIEIKNWGVFLPQLYKLYQVVKNIEYNPFSNLSIERKNGILLYKNMNV
jgi:hypothetical protein